MSETEDVPDASASDVAPTILEVNEAWASLRAVRCPDVPERHRAYAHDCFATLANSVDVAWPSVVAEEVTEAYVTRYALRGIAYPRRLQ